MKKSGQFIVVMLLLTSLLSAAEQQNAAELYKKAFALCSKPNEQTRDMLKFKIGQSNPRVLRYVEANRQAADLVVQAGEIENCDWQMSWSELFDALYMSGMKDVAGLVLADAALVAEKGDYEGALRRAYAVRTMAERLGNGPGVAHLIRIAVDSRANDVIQDLLSNMPADKDRLLRLRKELADAQDRQPSFEDVIRAEEQYVSSSTMPSGEKLSESTIQFAKGIFARMVPVAKLPYVEAQKELARLKVEAEKEAGADKYALLAAGTVEPQMRVHSLYVRHQTQLNATRAAVEIYTVKAETGSLPEKLPEGLPKDMFSGEDFDYQRADGGFALRCKGKEAGVEDLYEFEFKIADAAKEKPEGEAMEISRVEGEPNEAVEKAGEKAKGPVLEEVLAMWEAGEQDKAVEELLEVNWAGDKVFADDSVLDVNESEYEGMSVKKKEVRQRTVELMKTVRELGRRTLEVGAEALSAKEFEKAEMYFVAVDECTKALSAESALAVRKAAALGMRRAALMRLATLYDRMGEEVRLGEVREALRRL